MAIDQPKQPSLSERPVSAVWREVADKMEREVKDSPSHDLRRMIKERMEAVRICADEYDAERAELVREMGELEREWRAVPNDPNSEYDDDNTACRCADALAALLSRRGMRGTQGEA